MHIWQACRATSAALTFFDPITVDGSVYSDGGLIYNNPVEQVHGEASEMFQGRKQLLISLGTGTGKEMRFEPNLKNIALQLAELATQTERTADNFYRRDDARAARAGEYFRFNVPGLGDIGLEETSQLHQIEVLTEKYLNDSEVGQKVLACSIQLAEGALLLPETPLADQRITFADMVDPSSDEKLEHRWENLKRA